MHRTAEEISTATTVTIVVEDTAPEASRIPLQTERSSPRTRVKKEETRVTSGIETTTKRDHAAGLSTVGHPTGLDAAAVHHPHGITNQGTSLKRSEMRSIEKSLAMDQKGEKVWLYNPQSKKGRSPKLQTPWEGPWEVTNQVTNVVYRIQRTPRGRPSLYAMTA